MSVNDEEMLTAQLAAEGVGVAAPVNPALATEHAEKLVRLAGGRVIVAAGPELDERVRARGCPATATPIVERTYPFDQAPQALAHVEGGRAKGKVVITMV